MRIISRYPGSILDYWRMKGEQSMGLSHKTVPSVCFCKMGITTKSWTSSVQYLGDGPWLQQICWTLGLYMKLKAVPSSSLPTFMRASSLSTPNWKELSAFSPDPKSSQLWRLRDSSNVVLVSVSKPGIASMPNACIPGTVSLVIPPFSCTYGIVSSNLGVSSF